MAYFTILYKLTPPEASHIYLNCLLVDVDSLWGPKLEVIVAVPLLTLASVTSQDCLTCLVLKTSVDRMCVET